MKITIDFENGMQITLRPENLALAADKLGKDVVLKADGDKNLVVALVDRVPEIPWPWQK